jgi:hypothetical protein
MLIDASSCHMKLDIPVSFIPFAVDPPVGRQTSEQLMDTKHVNAEIHQWLMSIGLISPRMRIFHSTPHSRYLHHVDIRDPWPNDFVFLNFAYGGTGSTMSWFMPRSGSKPYHSSNEVNNQILSWDPDDCIEICRAEIGKPSLINTGIPHTLIPGTTSRVCYSMSLFEKNGQRARWSGVAERFTIWQQ